MSSISNKTSDDLLLRVENLQTYFYVGDHIVRAVDGLDLEIHHGEVFALVGESGCGKTITAMSIMGLITEPGRIVGGEICLEGFSLLNLKDEQLSKIRGSRLSLIFQDPQVRLNPVFTVGSHLVELLQVHQGLSKQAAYERSVDLLENVGLSSKVGYIDSYPHELSLGQAQRVMVALALAPGPDLLIADEPTSALDSTIQAQILELIQAEQRRRGTAVLLITHDLGVVAQFAQSVAVMYAGHILEQAPTLTLFHRAHHPYTQGLISSVPYYQSVDSPLYSIPGRMPEAYALPSGCRFAPRCEARVSYGLMLCEQQEPELLTIAPRHSVRCWLYQTLGNHEAPLKYA